MSKTGEKPKFHFVKYMNIYAIFTLDDDGLIIGVYVGITERSVEDRINNHLHSNDPTQKELHEHMKSGRYIVRHLERVEYRSKWKEYDWIDFFQKHTKYKVYNRKTGALKNKAQ